MLTLIGALSMLGATAQSDIPAYKKFPTVPPFTLLQADSTTFTKNDLKKQPVIIMYFSPTCDHCQHQWADMMKRKEDLKQFQIVMATYQPFEEMVEFYQKEHIADYPNIHVGRDEKYFLPPYYQIRSLPYLALYDKQGNLITTFEGNVKIDRLLDAFKKKKR